MKPHNKFHNRKDLTRWNRAGLNQFRYIDANAITHLETLRQLLEEKFPTIEYLAPTDANSLVNTSEIEHWLNQYYADRRDYGWEILRTFARSSHVLTEYINAYANEGFLETASEWENVRRLVAMLGYQPAPPASAETWLALKWKKDVSGIVKAGFAVKNQPAEEETTITFETLEDLEGDASLNELFPKDWNKSQMTVAGTLDSLAFKYDGSVKKGDWGVLTSKNGKAFSAVTVKEINLEDNEFYVDIKEEANNIGVKDSQISEIKLLLNPDFSENPLPYGENSFTLSEHAGINKDDFIVLKLKNEELALAKVTHSVGLGLAVDYQNLSYDIIGIYVAREVKVQSLQNFNKNTTDSSNVFLLPDDFDPVSVWSIDAKPKKLTKDGGGIEKNEINGMAHFYINADRAKRIFYLVKGQEGLEAVNTTFNKIEGKNNSLSISDIVLIKIQEKDGFSTASIESLQQNNSDFKIVLNPNFEKIEFIRGNFQLELHPIKHEENNKPIWNGSGNYTALPLDQSIDKLSSLLVPGKSILVKGKQATRLVSISSLDKKTNTLYVTPPFHNDETAKNNFPRHVSRIYANVVKAGHGETQPQSILGSGNATEINQNFLLEMTDISFVSDTTFPTGVRAGLTVTVDERIWQQVPELRLSSYEDHHYQVSIREDNTLSITFGDGINGRRLPTGFDNVRVSYRIGSGTSGNLDAEKLTEIAQPHSLINDFKHLLRATGGNNMESADSMRTNAPASVLALERAVSLSDFTHLATQHSSVLQARASSQIPAAAGSTAVEVVIVPPDGYELQPSQKETIKQYLQNHAVPGIVIRVNNYKPVYLSLKITLQIDQQAWQPEQVKAAVKQQLLTKLSLQNRKLGQSLFRSEVIGLVEQVAGVENCTCTIAKLGSLSDKQITVEQNELLFLNKNQLTKTLTISSEDLMR